MTITSTTHIVELNKSNRLQNMQNSTVGLVV